MKAAAQGRAATGVKTTAAIASLLAIGIIGWGAYRWVTEPIVPAFASDEEYFKTRGRTKRSETKEPTQ